MFGTGTALLLLSLLFSSCSAACPYQSYPDTDFNNGDLPNQPVSKSASTPAECAALCCSTPGCAVFSLNAGSPGSRWCYLKGASGWSSIPSSGCDSGCLSSGPGAGSCPPLPPPPGPPAYFPWYNLSIPAATRLELLLANMTTTEAIKWMNDAVPAIPRLGLPSFSWEGEALHGVSWAGVSTVFPSNIAWGATFNPQLVFAIGDVIATEARAKYMLQRASDGASAEFTSLSFMTPNNNLFLDSLWGRGQETYGEDPVLTSALTYAHIRALQFGSMEDTPAYTRILATSKHFLGYHIESFAGDAQYRLSHSFNYTEADIQQTYMPPFRAAISAKVAAVMCAYDGSNVSNPAWPHPKGPEPWGTPMCASPEMQRLLRSGEWEGYVISDEGSITFAGPGYHGYTSNLVDAAALCLNAGTDLALGGEYASTLAPALAAGNITAATIHTSLRRLLSAQFALGWFDSLAALRGNFTDPVPWNAVGEADIATPASRALSKEAAAQSLVLLRNQDATLPLRPAPGAKLALIGPGAAFSGTATSSYLGNYAGCESGPGGAVSTDPRCHVVSLLEALTAASAQPAAPFTLAYAPGCSINAVGNTSGFAQALAAAAGAEAIVYAGGLNTCQESDCSEGEANDRGVAGGRYPAAGLDLGGEQLALLAALRAAHPATPLIVVYLNGGPISSPWVHSNAEAILEAWYPGVEGGSAIADVLLGRAIPAGRMPVTMVQGMQDLPPHTDFVLATPPGRTHRYLTAKPLIP